MGLVESLVGAYARAELPGWGRVVSWSGFYNDERWRGRGMVPARGKWHGYEVLVDPEDWSERVFLVQGRYYELGSQLVMKALLAPGGTFIDVGANIGMLALLASHLVGAEGRVVCFEPNPQVRERLEDAVRRNAIPNFSIRSEGLSDSRETLVLSVPVRHSGEGTLAAYSGSEGPEIASKHSVQVVRGDDVDLGPLAGRVLLKVDVEGFECRALRGLAGTIERVRPFIMTEANAEHLRRAGTSMEEYFGILSGHGYWAYAIRTRRRGLRHGLTLAPVAGAEGVGEDMMELLWLPRPIGEVELLNRYEVEPGGVGGA
jgi:FkbM family methyltransferase